MNKKLVGVITLILLICILVVYKIVTTDESELNNDSNIAEDSNLQTVYVATGGGKEGFISDERVTEILKKDYNLNVVYDSWSNGKLVVDPLVRQDGYSKYDLMFCSDQRFYDYYKVKADKSKGESDRYNVVSGGLTLNTPIVIYSWGSVVDALQAQGIVTETEGVYYITDMDKLLECILQGVKWSDIGLSQYGTINIKSTDPVTSSPGATYYGLLLSIMSGGNVTENNMQDNLPKLKEFYEKSGYMNNTPADLFESYLKMGVGAYPMIVDYEKSIVEFAVSNPEGFAQVKDDIRVLYPTPTIWNSHCIASFTENGTKYYEAFENQEIQQIAWEKYGFRTGITGGSYDVSSLGIGIPSSITSTVSSLKMNMYNELISYLGE